MRPFLSVLVLGCALLQAACVSNTGTKVVHELIKLDLHVEAASNVNPDDEKRAAPIIVRVYELKNVDAFNASDFFSLQDKDKSVLNDDLVVRDQFQLRPGESKTIQRIADQATTTLGVLAAYRDLPNSVWRATWTLPSAPPQAWYRWGQKVKLTIRLDTNAIKITDEQPQSRK